jgi:hypothetical protein
MQHKRIKSISLFALSFLLFSFSSRWGGDSFQIYLNKKLVVKEFVHLANGTKSVQMNRASYDDQVDIYYSHCGQVGKSRTITIKDENNKLLKQLHFSDYEGSNSGMSFKVSDFLSWDKRNGVDQLNIYYSSKELTTERLLATFILPTDSKAKP